MSGWGNFEADPVGDLHAMKEQIAAQRGYRPVTLMMSVRLKQEYESYMRRMQLYLVQLEIAPKWKFVLRYRLRRRLGWTRLRIIFPRMYFLKQSARMRLLDFKHRNDPYWEY